MNEVENRGSLTPSPPIVQHATTNESYRNAFARAVKAQQEAMRAAAAETVSGEKGNTAEKKKPAIPRHLQDQFLEHTKKIIDDPIQRERHFPDPLAVRRIRVWAGEDLLRHEIKPIVVAALPPWAESHRPFQPWQDPVSGSFPDCEN